MCPLLTRSIKPGTVNLDMVFSTCNQQPFVIRNHRFEPLGCNNVSSATQKVAQTISIPGRLEPSLVPAVLRTSSSKPGLRFTLFPRTAVGPSLAEVDTLGKSYCVALRTRLCVNICTGLDIKSPG